MNQFKSVTFRLSILHTVFFLFLCFFVHAQDYYVSSENGSDSNTGLSVENAFATINKGIQAVNPGGTVYVMNGTYQNNGYGTVSLNPYTNTKNPAAVTINTSGLPGNYITLKNYDGHAPKIEFDGGGGIKIANGVNYVIVEGFKIEGPNEAIDYNLAIADRNYKVQRFNQTGSGTAYNNEVSYFSGKGIWGYGPHNNLIIRNNEVYNTPGSGIRFNDGDHITIEYNTVYNTTWWTSSASSAIVFAETIAASETDNTTEAKMIIRGNVVYNNWNRIPFFMASEPDNSILPSEQYGNAEYNRILDGQGIYVTRSDSNYKGTFLIENNLCVNNGKNGINFDRSTSSSAVIQNNTIYFNGVHEIIQDISVDDENNPAHRGQKVGGIKANFVKNIAIANNIIVVREDTFFGLETPNFTGTRIVTNNIFYNAKLPTISETDQIESFLSCCNQINVDPLLVSTPTTSNDASTMSEWTGYLQGTDFSLSATSPAIQAGSTNYTPVLDINKLQRPVFSEDIIYSASFESSTDGWYNFGSATVSQNSDVARTGTHSLKTTNRTDNFHSPRIDLNDKLVVGQNYTFYVWVKLVPDAGNGTAQLMVKSETEDGPIYNDPPVVPVSDSSWTKLEVNYQHQDVDLSFLYVKGPEVSNNIGVDYYIDDFSIVTQGDNEVDFSTLGSLDIGAYSYTATFSTENTTEVLSNITAYPNPVKDVITLINLNGQESISVHNILGKTIKLPTLQLDKSVRINVSSLKTGIYFVSVLKEDGGSKTIQIIKK